jgi:hypothetical protein
MKIYRTLQIVVTLIVGLGAVTGQSQIQTYYYSGPVNGYVGVDLTPGSGYYGGFGITFGTLTETLYYDPVTQSIVEQVGSLTINPSSGSFNIVNANGMTHVVVGSANLTVGNDGSFSFDRNRIYAYFNGNRVFTPGISYSDLYVPVTGNGVYQGQAFSGNWNIDLSLYTQVDAVNPTSLTFSESPSGSAYYSAGSGVAIPSLGLNEGTQDNTYYYAWGLNQVVATATTAAPEPNSIALLGLGLSALAFLRRR